MEMHTTIYDGAFKMKGNWTNQARRLKIKFPELTDFDLLFINGEEKELLRRLETKLNKNRSEVIELIKEQQVNQK